MTADMLYQILRSQIHAGKYAVGESPGTEAVLCAEYKVARGTVRAALQRLSEEGFLRKGPGRQRVVQRLKPLSLEKLRLASRHYAPIKGHYSASFGEHLRALDLHPTDIVLRSATRTACHTLAEDPRLEPATQISEQLGLAPFEEVLWCQRLRLANEEPIVLQWVVIPARLVPDVPLDYLIPGGLTQLYQDYGIVRRRVQTSYSPTRASKREGDFFRVGTGSPLIVERRVSFCRVSGREREVPYEYLVSLYTEHVALTFEWIDESPLKAVPKEPRGNKR